MKRFAMLLLLWVGFSSLLHAQEPVSMDVVRSFWETGAPETRTKGTEPPNPNTAILITENNQETHEWRMELVRHAQQSVEISGNYCGGPIFHDLLYLLESRMVECPNLKVFLLATAQLLESEDSALISLLEAQYPDQFHAVVTSFIPTFHREGVTIENHTKMVIVDGKYCVAGGSNIEEGLTCEGTTTPTRPVPGMVRGHFYKGSRDMDLVGRGDLAKELRELYFHLYHLWEVNESSGLLSWFNGEVDIDNRFFQLDPEIDTSVPAFDEHPCLAENVPSKPVLSGPDSNFQACSMEYQRIIEHAVEALDIGHLWFHPSDRLMNVFLEAVRRGVKIDLTTNGLQNNPPLCNHLYIWPSRVNYLPMMLGQEFRLSDINTAWLYPVLDVRIYEYAVPKVIYHKKAMTADHKVAVIGSYNISRKGDLYDYELTVTMHSEKVARAVEAVLARDREYSQEISWSKAYLWYFSPVHRALAEFEYTVIMRLM